jgi:hypothetical protein
MADINQKLEALRGLEASLDEHRRERARAQNGHGSRRYSFGRVTHLLRPFNRLRHFNLAPSPEVQRRCAMVWPHLRRTGIVLGVIVVVLAAGFGALWWRLASGPISLDIATPWITAAIEQNFGSRHKVEVGGTVIERDEHGRTAVRIRDIVVRETGGKVVASAPRAEVGLSSASLFTGAPRAESLNLVGAEVSVRISADGQFTLLAAEATPSADARVVPSTPTSVSEIIAHPSKSFLRDSPKNFAGFLAWIDSLSALGLDGYDLNEIGLKNGRLVVDDQRNGQRSVFEHISLSITRPRAGEVVFSIGSEHHERPWVLLAGVKPLGEGRRSVTIEARKIALRDVLLALRFGDGQLEADIPFSAAIRAEISQEGRPTIAAGRMVIGPGVIGGPGDGDSRVSIDRAEVTFEWDGARRLLAIPFQVVAGGNRFTSAVRAEAPPIETGGPWQLSLAGGTIVIPASEHGDQLLLNRIALRGQFDAASQRIDVARADISGKGVAFAFSGHLDFAGAEPRLAVGLAGQQMSVSAFKQLWPPMINPGVREWVVSHFDGGTIERVEIATNAPLQTLQAGGPPVPDDGLAIEIVANGAVITPIDGLPSIRDADFVTRISGRKVTIALGRGTVDLPSGRKLTVSDGIFEVPDTNVAKPAARARLRIDGPVPAAAELLASERLRDFSGSPVDPANSRGTVTAQVGLAFAIDPDAPKGSTAYTVTTDVTNFAIDKFVMSHKLEAQTLRITANNQGYQVKGDVRIAGTPAAVEYRKLRDETDASFRLQATLDDAARARLGFDLHGTVTGSIPVRVTGRVSPTAEPESRFSIDADLVQAKIENLLPGWSKQAGKPLRAAFNYIGKPKSTRLEDIVFEGPGTSVKGTVEIDTNGDVISANLPVFALSDGDKASLKADRGSDGLLKVVMRGEVIDGRGFVKSSLAGAGPGRDKRSRGMADVDVDLKLGAVAGFSGEAVRSVDLRFVRRGGVVRAFNLAGKLGVDAPLLGDMRVRNGKPVMYFETSDAGSLFRFTDTYPRMVGGHIWIAMDPPTLDQTPQDGVLNLRDFIIRGEAALDRVVAGAAGAVPNGVEFTRMRVEFNRQPGRLNLREGAVRGPVVGATIEGHIDYATNDVRMRGTFVPLYGINNAFGQIPIVGLFLGGEKEGMFGLTYEVVGPPGRSTLRVNPMSALAPGLLRKVFEFPNSSPVNDRLQEYRPPDPSR